MSTASQIVRVQYDTQKYWFQVWRYETAPELEAALYKANVRSFPKNTASYTIGYKTGDECGRMFLLDKSIAALAREASHMAFVVSDRAGHTERTQAFEDEHGRLTGEITAALYSKSRYF